MCEPSHSIVQFRDEDDDNNPTGPRLDMIGAPIGADSNLWDKMKKKISNWFHFSCPGFGHSETLERMTARMRLKIPQDTKYEAAWWTRSVKLDGRFYGINLNMFDCSSHREQHIEIAKAEALVAATTYANKVSIGNMTLLRQFLEISVRKSERPIAYIEQFTRMLLTKAKDQFSQKIKRLVGDNIKSRIETVIAIMMSFTRKRNLLVSEWSDDGTIWTPKAKIVLG